MNTVDAAAWDRRYSESARVWGDDPNIWAATELEGLTPGRALDLGAGKGRPFGWHATDGRSRQWTSPRKESRPGGGMLKPKGLRTKYSGQWQMHPTLSFPTGVSILCWSHTCSCQKASSGRP